MSLVAPLLLLAMPAGAGLPAAPPPAAVPAELAEPLADPAGSGSGTPAPPPPAAARDRAPSGSTELADPLTDPAAAAPDAIDAPAAPDERADTATDTMTADPLEPLNRNLFALHQTLDRALFRPAAMGYRTIAPKPFRQIIRNFFSNLGEPVVFLNYLLQFRIGKAGETLGRFVLNTVWGLGGTLDLARLPGANLPHRANGFGNTLAFYGVKAGPYLFIPLVGPTTLRDFAGGQADGLVLPVAVGTPFNRFDYQVTRAVLTGLDLRAENDAQLTALLSGALDPYATLRSVYLQARAGEVAALHAGGTPRPATPRMGMPIDDPTASRPRDTAAPAELRDDLADPAATPAPVP